MAGYSRKDIARGLREQGNLEAALSVLLDFTPSVADPEIGSGSAAPAGGPSVAGPGPDGPLIEQLVALPEAELRKVKLTHAQAKSLTGKEVASIRELPGGVELIAGTMAALKPAGA
jgi:hypothetical protein